MSYPLNDVTPSERDTHQISGQWSVIAVRSSNKKRRLTPFLVKQTLLPSPADRNSGYSKVGSPARAGLCIFVCTSLVTVKLEMGRTGLWPAGATPVCLM